MKKNPASSSHWEVRQIPFLHTWSQWENICPEWWVLRVKCPVSPTSGLQRVLGAWESAIWFQVSSSVPLENYLPPTHFRSHTSGLTVPIIPIPYGYPRTRAVVQLVQHLFRMHKALGPTTASQKPQLVSVMQEVHRPYSMLYYISLRVAWLHDSLC